MRRGFGLIGLLGTVILLVIVGAIAYNIGYGEGVSTHLPAVATNGSPRVPPATMMFPDPSIAMSRT